MSLGVTYTRKFLKMEDRWQKSQGTGGEIQTVQPGGYTQDLGPIRDSNVAATLERPWKVVPPQSWGNRSDTKHSKCLLLGGRRLNQLTLIPKPKGSGGARAATAQVGPANKRNDTKRCLPVEASLRPGEAIPW